MANTKSAEKALRQSKKRALQNLTYKEKIRALIRSIKTNTKNADILEKQYSELQSVLDKAVKNKVIHKNKAARLKERINKAAHAKPSEPTGKKRTRASKS